MLTCIQSPPAALLCMYVCMYAVLQQRRCAGWKEKEMQGSKKRGKMLPGGFSFLTPHSVPRQSGFILPTKHFDWHSVSPTVDQCLNVPPCTEPEAKILLHVLAKPVQGNLLSFFFFLFKFLNGVSYNKQEQ
jgi:hypothetical protein